MYQFSHGEKRDHLAISVIYQMTVPSSECNFVDRYFTRAPCFITMSTRWSSEM